MEEAIEIGADLIEIVMDGAEAVEALKDLGAAELFSVDAVIVEGEIGLTVAEACSVGAFSKILYDVSGESEDVETSYTEVSAMIKDSLTELSVLCKRKSVWLWSSDRTQEIVVATKNRIPASSDTFRAVGGFNMANTSAVMGMMLVDPTHFVAAGAFIKFVKEKRARNLKKLLMQFENHLTENTIIMCHFGQLVKIHYSVFRVKMEKWLSGGWTLTEYEFIPMGEYTLARIRLFCVP